MCVKKDGMKAIRVKETFHYLPVFRAVIEPKWDTDHYVFVTTHGSLKAKIKKLRRKEETPGISQGKRMEVAGEQLAEG